MENKELAAYFWKIADILELKDENPFRIRAYRRAAQSLETFPDRISEIINSKKLTDLPGIGPDLAAKIEEIIKTGKLEFLKKITAEIPPGLLEIMEIPGLGPRHTMLLYRTLGVQDIPGLKKAAASQKIRSIRGLGPKTEENILAGIQQREKFSQRFTLDVASQTAEIIIEEISKIIKPEKILAGGSLRRMQETIGDLDILVAASKPAEVISAFTRLKVIKKILASGPTKASGLLSTGIQVDLRVVPAAAYGAALHYFTGSKTHNIKMRQRAQKMGLKLNEYGIFKIKDDKKIAGRTEGEIFETLGLEYIPPEMREDTGEFELALKHRLPKIIEPEDIQGDLHLHSNASDGLTGIEEMVAKAREKNYRYIAITDHSRSAAYAGGLDIPRLLKQIDQIKKLNKRYKDIRILCGAEVDIKPDGSLDYPDEILRQLDIVNASIHSSFKMPEKIMTARIIRALENRYVTIFSHPTGRLINMREPYAVDLEAVIAAASRTGTFMEINSHPRRLDLNASSARLAKEKGVKISLATDSHQPEQMDNMKYGLGTARRGWLSASDVINTYPLEKLLKTVKIKTEEKK